MKSGFGDGPVEVHLRFVFDGLSDGLFSGFTERFVVVVQECLEGFVVDEVAL